MYNCNIHTVEFCSLFGLHTESSNIALRYISKLNYQSILMLLLTLNVFNLKLISLRLNTNMQTLVPVCD